VAEERELVIRKRGLLMDAGCGPIFKASCCMTRSGEKGGRGNPVLIQQ
jgi:hypothetical protein